MIEFENEEEMLTTIKQLNQALDIIANTAGDYTQNIVNDALYEVGYYTYEEDDDIEIDDIKIKDL